jgi:flavin-dependent dehydrogenase
MADEHRYDCLVIGGGPAGSTAATVLAQRGHKVALFEKQHGGRYQVGESLLPFCYGPLKNIGALEAVREAGFTKKMSVQFISANGRQSKPFYFDEHMEHESATTWQVLRHEFDAILLKNAQDHGVDVFEECAVDSVLEEDGATVGLVVHNAQGSERHFRAPITIDASGRNCFFVRKNRWRIAEPALNRLSIWAYFEGTGRDSGRNEGATTIAQLPQDGWFWYIPLHENRASVGVVAQANQLLSDETDPQAAFNEAIKKNPWIAERVQQGEQISKVRIISDYSYRSRYCAADGVVLCGDAFTFVDPVFSTGVFLALRSGEQAGHAVDAALKAGRYDGAQFEGYAHWFRDSLTPLRRLIFAFYDPGFSFKKLAMMGPEVQGLVTDCLIGQVDRDFTPLYEALDRMTTPPSDVLHGGVLERSR